MSFISYTECRFLLHSKLQNIFVVELYRNQTNGYNSTLKLNCSHLFNKYAIICYLCQKCEIMATKEEVELFLKQFHQKLQVFSIIFRDDRGKNIQTLADLEITPKYRETVIKEINVNDYCQGPIIDSLNNLGDMWVFGKDIKGKEVYIKISLGRENSQTICISFHIAEHKMKYIFKGEKQ